MPRERNGRGWLVAIGVLKIIKVVGLIALGVATLAIARRGATGELGRWAEMLGLGSDERVVRLAMAKVAGVSPHHLRVFAAAMFAYAGVFAVEGAGLLGGKRWAEYVTIFVTTSFVPFEIYELARGPSVPRVAALVLNAAILVYLVWRVVRDWLSDRERAGHGDAPTRTAPCPTRPSPGTSG